MFKSLNSRCFNYSANNLPKFIWSYIFMLTRYSRKAFNCSEYLNSPSPKQRLLKDDQNTSVSQHLYNNCHKNNSKFRREAQKSGIRASLNLRPKGESQQTSASHKHSPEKQQPSLSKHKGYCQGPHAVDYLPQTAKPLFFKLVSKMLQ